MSSTTGLSLYYPLATLSGSPLTAFDQSGNGYHATVPSSRDNPVQVDDATFGSCSQFSGNNCYLSAQYAGLDALFQSAQGPVGFTCWIQPLSLAGTEDNNAVQNIFFTYSSPDSAQNNLVLGIKHSDGQVMVYLPDPDNNHCYTLGTGALEIGKWHFVGLSIYAGSLVVQIDSSTFTLNLNNWAGFSTGTSDELMLGGAHSSVYFHGNMANLRGYNRSLDAAAMVEIMQADLANNLALYLPLAQINAGTTMDESSNGYTVDVYGDPNLVTNPQFGSALALNGAGQYLEVPGLVYSIQGGNRRNFPGGLDQSDHCRRYGADFLRRRAVLRTQRGE